MSGNPKGSKWRSTPQSLRHRKGLTLTISDAARERLRALAEASGNSMSAYVEHLVATAAPTVVLERPGAAQVGTALGVFAVHFVPATSTEGALLRVRGAGHEMTMPFDSRQGAIENMDAAARAFADGVCGGGVWVGAAFPPSGRVYCRTS